MSLLRLLIYGRAETVNDVKRAENVKLMYVSLLISDRKFVFQVEKFSP